MEIVREEAAKRLGNGSTIDAGWRAGTWLSVVARVSILIHLARNAGELQRVD